MRISSAVIGIFGFIILLILTGVCSLVSYSFTRGAVVDMWDSGLQIDSPVNMVSALINPEAFEIAVTATAPVSNVVIASPTPQQVATSLPLATSLPDNNTTITDTTAVATISADTVTSIAPDVTATTGGLTLVDDTAQNLPADVGQWSDPRQIRILLMGIDQRTDVEEDERFFRTDTMILVNIDPVRKTAGVLSIPRDLWVDIPNVGQGRINQAHRQGDVIQYPGGGGPALAMETVANNFGVRVDRYLVVNFDLFETVIDIIAPEGVEVCPTERIYDPTYPDIASYGTIEIEFLPGCQRLKGIILLRYARTRKSEGGDFDRAKRQQEVLKSTLNEVLSAGGIANFVSRIPALWTELSDSYNTNLSLTDVINLGSLMMEIDPETIRFAQVDEAYVTLGKSPTGDDVLLPSWGAISNLVEDTLYPSNTGDTTVLATDYQQENAAIYVYNGTDTGGLAGNTREWLLGRGLRVTDVGNASDHNNQPSEIRIYAANTRQYEQTAAYLASILEISPNQIKPGIDGLIAEGVMVVAGPDMPEKISR